MFVYKSIIGKLLYIAALIFVFQLISALSAGAACTIQITSAYTCNSSGDPYTPEVGDPYFVRFNWTVTGTPAASYEVKIQEANLVGTITGEPVASGNFWQYYGYSLPLDSSVPVTVTIDPQNVTGAPAAGRTYTFSFTPQPPTTPIQYYDTLTWTGQQTETLDWTDNANIVLNGFTWLGEPSTGSFLQVISQKVPSGSQIVTTSPTGDPVYQTNFSNFTPVPGHDTWVSTNTYNLAISSVRVNPTLLRGSTWSAISHLPSSFQPWLAPDSLVESTDPTIVSFVNTSLPVNYRSSMTPYDAARKLFLAVVAHTTYVTSPDNDGTAVATLQYKQANCFGFSTLLNACLREIGIPSRTLCGYWDGTNFIHCITEFYLPGTGLIEADASSAEPMDPTGTYSYDFGSDPELNSLCICSRGTAHATSVFSTGALQLGTFYYTTSNDYWGPLGTNSVLTAATLPASFSLYALPLLVQTAPSTEPTVSVLINPANGFGGNVVFSASGVPSGVTVSFAPLSSSMSTAAKFTVGASAAQGSYTITITGKSGSLTNSVQVPLIIASTPTIKSFTPTTGPSGTKVVISGTNLTGATLVTFTGGATAVPSSITATSATVVVPTGAETGAIEINTPGGTATSTSSFTFIPAPTITSFTPTTGPSGTKVVITGTNLTGATLVTFTGGATAVPSATVLVPTTAKTGVIKITTPGGAATSTTSFTI